MYFIAKKNVVHSELHVSAQNCHHHASYKENNKNYENTQQNQFPYFLHPYIKPYDYPVPLGHEDVSVRNQIPTFQQYRN